MPNEEILLTQEEYAKLEEEREYLISVRRKEVAENLKEAKSYGDLSENAEYDAAKNEQSELEARITKLDYTLQNATIIKEDEINEDRVNISLIVEVKDLDTKNKLTFKLVGATEVDPFSDPIKIGTDSPVGGQLLGKKVGDKVEIPVPDGVRHYEIKKIYKEG